MKKKNKRVIPGFGISMGVTLTMVSVIVLIPLATLVIYTAQMSFPEIIATITRGRVLSSFYVSFITAFAASAINAVMGLILAWVLVRYEFPGKRILDGKFGIQIAYTRLGITFALIFVGIPFVVRSIQPVLEKLDPSYEEAASVLGASRTRIFWKVIFPEVLPSLCTGFGLAFGRCLGEYGSIVFIAGNKPYYTEITPLIIMSELQEFDYPSATAIALVMLIAAFLILFINNLIQARNTKILNGNR